MVYTWERMMEEREQQHEIACLKTQERFGIHVTSCDGAICESECPFLGEKCSRGALAEEKLLKGLKELGATQ